MGPSHVSHDPLIQYYLVTRSDPLKISNITQLNNKRRVTISPNNYSINQLTTKQLNLYLMDTQVNE